MALHTAAHIIILQHNERKFGNSRKSLGCGPRFPAKMPKSPSETWATSKDPYEGNFGQKIYYEYNIIY